jgi:hypothetical protein
MQRVASTLHCIPWVMRVCVEKLASVWGNQGSKKISIGHRNNFKFASIYSANSKHGSLMSALVACVLSRWTQSIGVSIAFS